MGLSLGVLLGVLAPLAIVTTGDVESRNLYTISVLWGICLFAAVRLGSFMVLRRAELIRLVFYVFCYVFVGITALAQVSTTHFPLALHFTTSVPITDDATISRTATLFLIGVIAHEVGYMLGGRRVVAHADPASGAATQHLPRVLNVRLVHVLCVVGVLVTLLALAASGLGPFLTSREAAGEALANDLVSSDGSGAGAIGLLWYRLSHTLPFVSFFLLLHLMRNDRSRRTAGYLGTAATLAICNILVNNPISNSRLWSGVVLFGLASVFVDMRSPRAVAWTTAGMTAALLVVFPYADAFRWTDQSESYVDPLTGLSTNGSFSAFQTAANGLSYVDHYGFSWGYQLLGSIFTLVPRVLWRSKPPDTGFLIDPIYNRAATFWTEMHVNFGVVGVLVGLALLGILARRCDDSFKLGRTWALLVIPVAAPYYFIVLRGTLSAAIGTLLPVLAVLLLPMINSRLQRHASRR
jgi:hypothetical protein